MHGGWKVSALLVIVMNIFLSPLPASVLLAALLASRAVALP